MKYKSYRIKSLQGNKLKGYALAKKEFEETLRKISMMDLGIILIAHSARRIEVQSDNSEIEFFSPALDKRCYEVCNQLVDIIAFIDVCFNQDGTTTRWLYTRRTPTIMAGSRWKYLDPKIPFGYQELISALNKAIDMSEAEGAVIVDKMDDLIPIERSYDEIAEESRDLWTKLIQKDEKNAEKIMDIVEKIFGTRIKLSQIQRNQTELYELVVAEMKDLL